ncbi:hypothetical protein WN943_004461 [Citrus x changshan-huyou]
MWKESNVRRSPRISGLNLNACQGQQQMGRVKVDSTKKSTAANANANANANADANADANAAAAAVAVAVAVGPASRTRARKKRKLKPLQDVAAANTTFVSPIAQESEDGDTNGAEDGEEQNLKYQPSNSDQPSSVPSAPQMPEKRVLELILNILQRKDTHEIFAEPVDTKEVEDYYEIIKEPMDFGTMRAKLHEGMYTSLDQFEHDVFLISGNAMHFNSSGSIYFRQARIIHELSKRVFHALRTDPGNFELEFSETRRRTGRRPQIEPKGQISSSILKPATKFRSNSMTANVSSKTVSGATILRRRSQRNPEKPSAASTLTARDNKMLLGATGGRRTSFSEADRRSTYSPRVSDNSLMSNLLHSHNARILNTFPFQLVNQQDMGYRESLMLFVRDLGPTAQMVAERKLHGCSAEAPNFQSSSSNCWFQAPQCHNPPAHASVQQRQAALDNNSGSIMSQNLLEHHLGNQTVPGNSCGRTELCDSSKVGGRMDIYAASVEVEPNGVKNIPHAFKEDICRSSATKNSGSEMVEKSRNNMAISGSNPPTAAARELNFSVAGLKDKGSLSATMFSDKSMLDNQAQSLKSTSDYSHSDLLCFSLRKNHSSSSLWPLRTTSMSTSPQTKGSISNPGSQCLRRNDQASTAQCQSHEVNDSSRSSQDLKSNQHLPLAPPFTFDLSYLKSRLGQITTPTRDKSLLPTGRSFLDKTSYQKLDDHQQSSLDSKHTDLVLQLLIISIDHSSDKEELIKVGMKVNSDKEAYDLYNKYALRKGFSICIWNIRRDTSNKIRQREFVCSKQGFQLDEDLCEVKKVNNLETRTCCKVMIRLTVNDGEWVISHIYSYHNHELAKPEERQFLKSSRKILSAHGAVIRSMVNAGIRASKSYSYLANEIGVAEMIKKFKLEDHSWLRKLHSLKEKWCPAFSLDTFSANMKSTQRSESTDNVFHDNEAKEVRLEELQDYYSSELSGNNTQSGQLLRLSELMHARTEIYSIVSLRVSGTRIVKEQLAHTVKLWEDDMETMSIFENSKKMDDHSNHNVLVNDKLVLNPAKIRTKGLTNGRIKSNLEKQKRKTTKGQKKNATTNGPSHPIALQQFSTFNPSIHNLSFSSILQGIDRMPHLNQHGPSSSLPTVAFGQWPHLIQVAKAFTESGNMWIYILV